MVEKIQFLIPNLNRRPDRWEWCRESLLSQGVPGDNIIRFPTFDGLCYVASDGDHRNLTVLQNALSNHFGCLPLCLRKPVDMVLTQYAWFASWYAMLDRISQMPDNEYACWLMDDYAIHVPYDHLLHFATILSRVAKRAWRTLYAIQLSHYTHPETYRGLAVTECPRFQYGLSSPDDAAMICTPRGAKWMMHYINYRARVYRKRKLDPVLFFAIINASNSKNGFFGVRPPKTPVKYGRAGLAWVTENGKIAMAHECPEITDRQMSKYYLKRK